MQQNNNDAQPPTQNYFIIMPNNFPYPNYNFLPFLNPNQQFIPNFMPNFPTQQFPQPPTSPQQNENSVKEEIPPLEEK